MQVQATPSITVTKFDGKETKEAENGTEKAQQKQRVKKQAKDEMSIMTFLNKINRGKYKPLLKNHVSA